MFEKIQKTVLLKQSFFGLPWVVIGAIFPCFFTSDVTFAPWFWCLIAFLSARLSGMAFNRLIDHSIDEKNPRTASRPLPSGEMRRLEVLQIACLFLLLFFFSMYMINSLTFSLSFYIAAQILVYSFTKRFTWLCHFVLAFVQFFTPVAASIATSGQLFLPTLYLGAALFCCIAANDILYACQDLEFDREEKLFSIPAQFGYKKAVTCAKVLHGVSVFVLVCLGITCNFSLIYFLGPLCAAGIFYRTYEQLFNTSVEKIFSWSNIAFGAAMLVAVGGELLWQKLS